MKKSLISIFVMLLASAAVFGATISTTLTVTNATGSIGASGVTFSGQSTLSNIGNGTFAGTMALTPDSSSNLNAQFTITLTSGDKINGTVAIPASALGASTLTAAVKITGGTGAYAGATGSFPQVTGTLSIGLSTTLTFSGAGTITTGGGGSTGNEPSITDVLDAGSYTKNVAQGSIFVVKGTNLSASGYTAMSFPLPTSSSGVKITFTPAAGGNGTDAYLVYLYNLNGVNQLAALAPSTLAVGNYNVTVTNGTASSAGFATRVVQRKPGLITANSAGNGLAVVQNYISAAQIDIARFTTFAASGYTFSPSKPGQTLIAWSTGMGPVAGGDNTASGGYNFAANGVDVQVIVGGMTIRPAYAGRTPGLAGTDQINFTLPSNVPTGCAVPFQVSVGGVKSNPTFLAIAPDGNASACTMPGFTTAELQQYDQGKTYSVGSASLTQFSTTVQGQTVKVNAAGASFIRYSGFNLDGLAQAKVETSTSGACTVTHVVSTDQSSTDSPTIIGLDAGTLTLTGPSGSGITNLAFNQDPTYKFYSLGLGYEGISIPGSTNYNLVGGTYTVNGAGGKDVGRFSSSLTLGSPLTLSTPLPATVVRSSGLKLDWNGGNASDLVYIGGGTSTESGTGLDKTYDSWNFVCTTNAGARTFTVPASVLTQIPAASIGALSVSSGAYVTFTAPLVAGGNLDAAAFVGLVGIGGAPAYQ